LGARPGSDETTGSPGSDESSESTDLPDLPILRDLLDCCINNGVTVPPRFRRGDSATSRRERIGRWRHHPGEYLKIRMHGISSSGSGFGFLLGREIDNF